MCRMAGYLPFLYGISEEEVGIALSATGGAVRDTVISVGILKNYTFKFSV